jgi:hypothetical protein
MKVGIKNFSKIIKKCINEKIRAYGGIIEEINSKLF